MNRFGIVLTVIAALAIGFLAGRYSHESKEVDAPSVDVAGEKPSDVATIPTSAKSVEKATERRSEKKVRYSNVRKLGEEFKVGLLDGKLDDNVKFWESEDEGKHYQFGFTLTNNTEGRMLKPRVSLFESKDNFANKCQLTIVQGPYDSGAWVTSGTRESVEIAPGDSVDFKVELEPSIVTASDFKATIAFSGTGVKSTWDPRLRVRFKKDVAIETTKLALRQANSDQLTLCVGKTYRLENAKFAIESVGLVRPEIEVGSGVNKTKRKTEETYLAVALTVTNLDERKEISCAGRFTMTDDVGNVVLNATRHGFGYGELYSIPNLFGGGNVKPGKSFKKVAYFEEPLPNTQFVEIEFQQNTVGNKNTATFLVDATEWNRSDGITDSDAN